jgi:hypothetical protein
VSFSFYNFKVKKNLKKKKRKLDSLLTAREEGENFKPYYSFVALSSKKLSANRRTDGRTETAKYVYDVSIYIVYMVPLG